MLWVCHLKVSKVSIIVELSLGAFFFFFCSTYRFLGRSQLLSVLHTNVQLLPPEFFRAEKMEKRQAN